MKLDFGSGNKRIGNDWTNVDAFPWGGNTDIIWDMGNFPYPFENESIDEITCGDTLEHLSWRLTDKVLKEFYRILKKNTTISIRVPDCGKAMEYYVKQQICQCVAHKPESDEEKRGDPNCMKCSGAGRINPNRWLLSFVGAQKHGYDAHLNIFTESILKKNLINAGFSGVNFQPDSCGWKLKATAKKL